MNVLDYKNGSKYKLRESHFRGEGEGRDLNSVSLSQLPFSVLSNLTSNFDKLVAIKLYISELKVNCHKVEYRIKSS